MALNLIKRLFGQPITLPENKFNLDQIELELQSLAISSSNTFSTLNASKQNKDFLQAMTASGTIDAWGSVVVVSSSSNVTLTLPTATANDLGKRILIRNGNSGLVTIVQGANSTYNYDYRQNVLSYFQAVEITVIAESTVVTTGRLEAMAEEAVNSSRSITKDDGGKILKCAAGVTLTIPANLSPRPRFVVEFDSGTVSIAVSGGAQINGSTTTIARSISNNQAGFVVVPRAGSDGYGASGG